MTRTACPHPLRSRLACPHPVSPHPLRTRLVAVAWLTLSSLTIIMWASPVRAVPSEPTPPSEPTAPAGPDVTIDIGGTKPSVSITILVALTVMSVAPALLLLCTSFTKVFVVLSITRNALGLTTVPPNQVIAGLALFITLFIMSPTLTDVNQQGVQPYLRGEKTQSAAFADGVAPLKTFMVTHTREDEIALFAKVSGKGLPKNRESIPLSTLIPAFIISELRTAFVIGFVIFVPFLVIDMVIAATLMSLGMMMLPPVTISLPFKLLLFVLVDGWGLIVTALVASYR
ncbi:MAG: flagellar type III secretion system pore protein FliP [Micromonosporaceae bacterium]|nr:flagellar type III secretion system pore protein FliP [Micromonosporaceae bacterium]